MLPLLFTIAVGQDIKPLNPVPAPRHLAWHRMEQYAFVHFGPNTFTDKEWGEGLEDPKIFNPTALDCKQWARVAKAAGLNGIILTAKHHDGFCLWPTKYSIHTVAQSRWKDGKGDVLRELSDACKAEGLKLGVYLSPWDRNHPTYGTPEYNQVFAKMLREVLTNYGPIFEVWFDGANGEGPNGKKQVYDWNLFINTVRECQPGAVIFSDAGPDIRWVGNESGHSDPECWATVDRDRYVPGTPLYKELTKGKKGGKNWVPAECDVSIRPGWFYHAEEDGKVKTPEQLLKLWEESVGQNANFLLNIPPDRRGLWHENDVRSLVEWGKLRDRTYGRSAAKRGKVSVDGKSVKDGELWQGGTVEMEFPSAVTFDRVELREPVQLGQRIARFQVQAFVDGGWKTISEQTTVGVRRIVRMPKTTSDRVRIVIQDSLAQPVLSDFVLYSTGASRG